MSANQFYKSLNEIITPNRGASSSEKIDYLGKLCSIKGDDGLSVLENLFSWCKMPVSKAFGVLNSTKQSPEEMSLKCKIFKEHLRSLYFVSFVEDEYVHSFLDGSEMHVVQLIVSI